MPGTDRTKAVAVIGISCRLPGAPAPAAPYTLTGVSRGLLSSRISHFLGLAGPSLSVDTGQSSSLVSVHLAAESLRHGEAGMALAGGVQLNLAAEAEQRAEQFGALSP